RMGCQPMAVVCATPGRQGKTYLSVENLSVELLPDATAIWARVAGLCERTGLIVPDEPIASLPFDCYDNALGIRVRPYGLTTFGHLFTPRQTLSLLAFTLGVRCARQELDSIRADYATPLIACLALIVSRLTNFSSSLCTWFYDGGRGVKHVFARQAI